MQIDQKITLRTLLVAQVVTFRSNIKVHVVHAVSSISSYLFILVPKNTSTNYNPATELLLTGDNSAAYKLANNNKRQYPHQKYTLHHHLKTFEIAH